MQNYIKIFLKKLFKSVLVFIIIDLFHVRCLIYQSTQIAREANVCTMCDSIIFTKPTV